MAAVLVHIDLEGKRPHRASLVALAAGRQLASSWGATLYAAVIAKDASDVDAAALGKAGADKIMVATTEAAIAPLWAAVGGAWQTVLDQLRPRLVLFGADAPSAPELAPRTGARIGARLLMRASTQARATSSCAIATAATCARAMAARRSRSSDARASARKARMTRTSW